MNNKKISTFVGTIILILIVIIVGMVVFVYEKKQNWGVVTVQTQSLNNTGVVKTTGQNKESSPTPLIVSKPAIEWENVCKNISARYQVKYPDEWVMIVGDDIRGFQVVNDCNNVKKELLYGGRINRIMFAPSVEAISGGRFSGIWITAFPNTTQHSFVDPTTELTVDGEKMTWVHRSGARLLHHGTTEYEIVVNDDVSEDLVTEFFSTFKFLP